MLNSWVKVNNSILEIDTLHSLSICATRYMIGIIIFILDK